MSFQKGHFHNCNSQSGKYISALFGSFTEDYSHTCPDSIPGNMRQLPNSQWQCLGIKCLSWEWGGEKRGRENELIPDGGLSPHVGEVGILSIESTHMCERVVAVQWECGISCVRDHPVGVDQTFALSHSHTLTPPGSPIVSHRQVTNTALMIDLLIWFSLEAA